MDPRDDDIEFDFFEDEPATTESPGRPAREASRAAAAAAPGCAARPARRTGVTPLLRLLAPRDRRRAARLLRPLIQSCASTSKHDAYATTWRTVGTIAQQLDRTTARRSRSALTTPGVEGRRDSTTKLGGIAEQERQNVDGAQQLDPPGPLREENQQLIEALQLRVSGVKGLADTFAQTAASKADRRGGRARRAGRPAARERRRLGRPLQGAGDGRAAEARAISGVAPPTRTSSRTATCRRSARWRSSCSGCAARRRRHADRRARHEHRRGQGAAGGQTLLAATTNTVDGDDRPRVPGRRSRTPATRRRSGSRSR